MTEEQQIQEDWISVEFALPVHQVWVLTIDKSGQMQTAFCDQLDNRYEWVLNDDGESDNITHWMPLPKPPEITKES